MPCERQAAAGCVAARPRAAHPSLHACHPRPNLLVLPCLAQPHPCLTPASPPLCFSHPALPHPALCYVCFAPNTLRCLTPALPHPPCQVYNEGVRDLYQRGAAAQAKLPVYEDDLEGYHVRVSADWASVCVGGSAGERVPGFVRGDEKLKGLRTGKKAEMHGGAQNVCIGCMTCTFETCPQPQPTLSSTFFAVRCQASLTKGPGGRGSSAPPTTRPEPCEIWAVLIWVGMGAGD